MYYRFLIHKCPSLILQTFKLCSIFSKIGLRPHEYHGSSRAVKTHFWDPLGLHVAQTGWVVDGETNQEHILKQIQATQSCPACSIQCNFLTVSGYVRGRI